MKHLITILFICIACIGAHADINQAATEKTLGDSAYTKQAYDMALIHYQSALDHDGVSSNLYYNLGNTYYRLNDLGHAIICYERALRINPANREAQANLSFVRKNLPDKIHDNTSFLESLQNKITARNTPDTWAWLALGCFILVLGAGALYLFANNVRLRKFGFFGGICLLGIFIYLLLVARSAANAIDKNNEAVVIAPVTYMRSEPTTAKDKTEKVLPVHAGTKVELVDSAATPDDAVTKKWYEVRISGGSRAWVAQSDVEHI